MSLSYDLATADSDLIKIYFTVHSQESFPTHTQPSHADISYSFKAYFLKKINVVEKLAPNLVLSHSTYL